MLYFGQGNFIYFPRSYFSGKPEFDQVETIRFLSDGKPQHAYIPKREGAEVPRKVWWVFGGNGSVALDWFGSVDSVPAEKEVAFVLFDYPGYGKNEGTPNPERIQSSIDASLPEVANSLGLLQEELLERSNVIGHSLGAAVAFDFANRYRLDQVIAISPFTTMEAMAKRTMGSWAALILSHRYDNEISIDEILESNPEVRMTIFHGEEDRLIPISMGRSLARRDEKGTRIEFVPVPEAGHNDIVLRILPVLVEMVGE